MNNPYISCFYFLIASISTLVSATPGICQSPQDEITSNYDQFKNLRISQPEEALLYATKAYEIALKSNDLIWVAKTSRAVGSVFNTLGSYDSGYNYLLKSIEYGELINDDRLLKYAHNDAGLNRRNLSKYDQALTHFFASLTIRQKNNNKQDLSIIYNNIGLVYYALEDYKKAVEYHSLSLKLNKELDDPSSSVINMVNLGLCYMGNKKHEIALDYFLDVLEICKTGCFGDVHIQALGGLGHINYFLKNHEAAKKYFIQSNDLSKSNDIQKYLASNYNYLAQILFEANNVDSAMIFLNTAQTHALATEDVEWIRNNLKLYSEFYAKAENFEQAFFYHQQYITFRDSSSNDEVYRNLSKIHVNIQKSKDETIIKGLDNEIIAITQQTIMLAFVALAISVLLFLVYRNNKVRKRINAKLGDANLTIENKNAELNEMNLNLDTKVKERTESLKITNEALIDSRTELDNFIYKISHDIQGPLATLRGVCDIGLIDVKDQMGREYLTRLSTTAEELNSIILRLQRVNQIISTKLEYVNIDFEEQVKVAINKSRELSLEYSDVESSVSVQENLNFYADIDVIAVIINNLVRNAFQFYDSDKRKSIVKITVNKYNDNLLIEIRDNGIGIEVDDTKDLFRMFSRFSGRNRTGGIGLFLVKTAVDKLNGKISVSKNSQDEDTVFIVELPYETKEHTHGEPEKVDKLVGVE
jgi:signal transduction histidine kinase